jgi:putative transposase
MRGPYTQLYLHLVWATWDRLPLITSDVEVAIHACIADKCRELKCEPIAVGGIEDHIHLLVGFHAAMAPATIVKEVKGASSHLMTHKLRPDTFFRWQVHMALSPSIRTGYLPRRPTLRTKGSTICRIPSSRNGRSARTETQPGREEMREWALQPRRPWEGRHRRCPAAVGRRADFVNVARGFNRRA